MVNRTPSPRTFIVDETYDQEHARVRGSRYGVYLTQRADMFQWDNEPTTDPVQFAFAAWQIANSPIMAPGYVRSHPRALTTVTCQDEDYRPAVTVNLAAPLPDVVAHALNRRTWRGWQCEGYSEPRWHEPDSNDRLAAYTTLAVRIPIHETTLLTPRYHGSAPDIRTAKSVVRMLCDQLNEELDPIIAALEGTASR